MENMNSDIYIPIFEKKSGSYSTYDAMEVKIGSLSNNTFTIDNDLYNSIDTNYSNHFTLFYIVLS